MKLGTAVIDLVDTDKSQQGTSRQGKSSRNVLPSSPSVKSIGQESIRAELNDKISSSPFKRDHN